MHYKLRFFLVILLPLSFFLSACNHTLDPETVEPEVHKSNCLWQRISNNFKLLEQHPSGTTLDNYVQYFRRDSLHMKKLGAKAEPYLFYIVSELEQRNLPGELALLPMVESAYHPHAKSEKGAAGIWQLAAPTGKRYGICSNGFFDGRFDIKESTKAALDYLEFLYKDLNQDWFLALAAYNAGEGRIKKAIAQNMKQGKPTDFWSLKLPKQTKDFVPKILALSHIIANVERYNLHLHSLKDEPYFVTLNAKPMNVAKAATLANMDLKEFSRLNPGFDKYIYHPAGRNQVLIPAKKAATFLENLEQLGKKFAIQKIHVVAEGENLSVIASKYKVSVQEIKDFNTIESSLIKPGAKLAIPDTIPPITAKKKKVELASFS